MKEMDQITFAGYLDSDDNDLIQGFKEVLYNIIDNRTYKDSKYKPEFLPISDEMDKIKYVIGTEPQLQAWSDASANVIGINLFTLAVFSNLSLFREVFKVLDASNSIEIDRLKAFFDTVGSKSEETMNELLNLYGLFEKFSIQKSGNGYQMIWNLGLFGSGENIEYAYTLLQLVYQHEMAHWHLGKFNDETRMQYIGRALKELMDYLETYKDNPDVYDSLHAFLDGEVQYRWAEEIAADIMSYINVMSKCTSPADRKNTCVSIAIYYALMRLQEFHYNGSASIVLSDTHPPVYIRERVVERLAAKEYNNDITSFEATNGGAWFIVQSFFNRVLENMGN